MEYPQSNGRAEVGVKTAKRILLDNLNKDGSLDNDKVVAALLQYKNTPLPDIELSPAQILFHRELRDSVPSHRDNYHLHKEWVIAAEERASVFAKRNKAIEQRYNQHTRRLPELSVHTHVLIQTARNKWRKQGVIVEKLPHRQYRIKVLGSNRITLRNRRFIKPCSAVAPQKLTTPSSQKIGPGNHTVSINRNVEILQPILQQNPRLPPPEPTVSLQSASGNNMDIPFPFVDSSLPLTPNISTASQSALPTRRVSARLQNLPPPRQEITEPENLCREVRNLGSYNNHGLQE